MKLDVTRSINDVYSIVDGSIKAIWSSHVLEHLYRHEVAIALAACAHVLKIVGLLLTMPDPESIAELVVKDGLGA